MMIRQHTERVLCNAIWYGSAFTAMDAATHSCNVFGVHAGQIVQEMATGSVRAQANTVECATVLGLVFWMALNGAQFIFTVRKLTFLTVFAFAGFLEWTTQFCLVATE